jgi:hypothetical protein
LFVNADIAKSAKCAKFGPIRLMFVCMCVGDDKHAHVPSARTVRGHDHV